MKKLLFIWLLYTFLLCSVIFSQEEEIEERKRIIEEERIWELSTTEISGISGSRSKLISDFQARTNTEIYYGGWFTYSHTFFKNADKNKNTQDTLRYIDSYDLRLWTRIERPKHNDLVYSRVKFFWNDREYIQGRYIAAAKEVYDATRLDMGYYEKKWNGLKHFRNIKLTLGRRQFRVGRGIAYSGVNDGVDLQLNHKSGFNFDISASKIIRSKNDLDSSRPYPGKNWSRRYFYALEIDKKWHPKHTIDVYGLIQRDHNKEVPENRNLEYDYDSEYYGIYLKGELISNLKYWGEFIKEEGHSYATGTNANPNLQFKENIDAYAFVLGMQYFADKLYGKPSLVVEYAEASGDTDRQSVSNTVNGNLRRTEDECFIPFGIFPSGAASSFKFSNLHILKVGANIKPLEKIEIFKDFMFTYEYYRYKADESAGAISDALADLVDKDIGKEHDFIISWRPLSDLKISFKYGRFKPGNAYLLTNRDSKTYWNLSTTLDF
ncbi:MAG: alginate export family protein [Candidatus Hydrogenedentota bacterium]